MRKVIVLAGVFDPVHKGHISAAKSAAGLQAQVVFLPERVPQHKHAATPYKHRLEMLKIATSMYSNFQVLDYPKDHHRVVETFTWLQEQFPGRKFTWLVGADVAGHMESWPDVDKLGALGVESIIVASRRGMITERLPKIDGLTVKKFKTRSHHISSSFLREDLANHRNSLPAGVYDYTKKHKLYQVVKA